MVLWRPAISAPAMSRATPRARSTCARRRRRAPPTTMSTGERARRAASAGRQLVIAVVADAVHVHHEVQDAHGEVRDREPSPVAPKRRAPRAPRRTSSPDASRSATRPIGVLQVDGVRHPRERRPRPPDHPQHERRAREAAGARVADDQVGDLRDGVDEDEVEEELEVRRAPLARVPAPTARCAPPRPCRRTIQTRRGGYLALMLAPLRRRRDAGRRAGAHRHHCDRWQDVPPAPEARSEVVAATVGGRVAVVGGFRRDGDHEPARRPLRPRPATAGAACPTCRSP